MVKFLPAPDSNNVFWVKAGYGWKEQIKRINGRVWNKSARVWEVPIENMDDALAVFPNAMVHPWLQELVQQIRERNERAIEIKNLDNITVHVDGLKGTLFDYQAVGKAFLHLLQPGEGAILAFDMGLGKTITSIAEFLDLYNKGMAKRCLVVCPASLKYSAWEKEIKKWTDLSYIVIEGNPYHPEDREVLIEVEEEKWELDENGKRKFVLEPVHSKQPDQLYFAKPIPVSEIQKWVDENGKVDFWKYVFPLLAEDAKIDPRDKPATATIATLDTMPEHLAAQIEPTVALGDGAQYIVGVQVYRYQRHKKKFLKKKTGRIVEKIVKMHGRDLREIQYQQDDRAFMIVNYEAFLTDTDIMPVIDQDWVVILDECFPYETRVTLADGTNVPIGFLVENKLDVNVLSYNLTTNTWESKPVTNWYKNKRHIPMVKVTLEDGTTIEMTANHKVYTKNRGYIAARDLTTEDNVIWHKK